MISLIIEQIKGEVLARRGLLLATWTSTVTELHALLKGRKIRVQIHDKWAEGEIIAEHQRMHKWVMK